MPVASHDMREPLRKIKAFDSLLRTDYGDSLNEEGLSYLNRMEDAASRLMRLLDALLQFSRVETHGYPFEAVRVADAVQGVLDEFTPLLREQGLTVEVEADVVVDADRDQIRQLLSEIISNATDYSDEIRPKRIRIAAEIEFDENGGASASSPTSDKKEGNAQG
jgi:signal transduction histidine kinase